MKKIIITLLLLIVVISINAQQIIGSWEGVLKTQGTEMKLIFNISQVKEGLKGTLDSPNQKAFGIPITSINYANKALNIDISNLQIKYDGELVDNNTIDGIFSQGNFSTEMLLKRVEKENNLQKKSMPTDKNKSDLKPRNKTLKENAGSIKGLNYKSTHFENSQDTNLESSKINLITTDIDNFWIAWEKSKTEFDSLVFDSMYIAKGSEGLKGFMPYRIVSAGKLVKTINKNRSYYEQLKKSTLQIESMKDDIKKSLINLSSIYPDAKFPPVYFVVGALNSGGTSIENGLVIGVDMYGKTTNTKMEELRPWLQTVLKPVTEIPYIVAHELIHFQQNYKTDNLLGASIKEGSADFIAELIAGKHINHHVHDFANPIEEKLWNEFKEIMHNNDFSGWLYSSIKGRPNDLGYWMGYKITESYYKIAKDKKEAISDILNIKDFDKFLKESNYKLKY